MSSSNKTVAIAALAGAAAIGAIATYAYLRNQDGDGEDSDLSTRLRLFLTEDDDKRQALVVYEKLSRALTEVRKNVDTAEALVSILKASPPSSQDNSGTTVPTLAELKKLLAEASSDLDFLFGELDQIRGDESVKRKRKQVADRINELSSCVDDAMAFVSSYEFQLKQLDTNSEK